MLESICTIVLVTLSFLVFVVACCSCYYIISLQYYIDELRDALHDQVSNNNVEDEYQQIGTVV